ncbi:hypothetical protein CIRG_08830 [Coccidioides immitis RMSCC 2394]|uniref:Uncharacterized protein n=1 Tax=Coccidioides immitis RMSCC 2394 TaxID=404692 RepID=A0A0J6YPM0_COCIT|nr:hypothetical protein CIRG_08830 [Coccidioides immitis RMSCC 2394]
MLWKDYQSHNRKKVVLYRPNHDHSIGCGASHPLDNHIQPGLEPALRTVHKCMYEPLSRSRAIPKIIQSTEYGVHHAESNWTHLESSIRSPINRDCLVQVKRRLSLEGFCQRANEKLLRPSVAKVSSLARPTIPPWQIPYYPLSPPEAGPVCRTSDSFHSQLDKLPSHVVHSIDSFFWSVIGGRQNWQDVHALDLFSPTNLPQEVDHETAVEKSSWVGLVTCRKGQSSDDWVSLQTRN